MKKGMATALGAAAVVVAGWLGATWYTGTKIEARIERLLTDVNQYLAAEVPLVKVRLERRDYARGVFTSQVRYALVLEQSDVLPPNFPVGQIEFDTHIEHGPLPLRQLARGAFAPVLAASHSELVKTDNVARVFDLTGGAPPYRDDTVIHYNGQVESQARIAAMRYADEKEGLTLEFSGLDVTSQGDAQFPKTAVKGEGRAETLLVSFGDKGHFLMSDLTLVVDNRLGKFGVTNGEASMTAGRIEFVSKGGEAKRDTKVEIDDFVYRVAVGENDTALSIEVGYGLEQLTLQIPSPRIINMDLGGGEILAKLENLNGAALQELQQAYVAMLRAFTDPGRDGLDAMPQDDRFAGLAAGGAKLLAGKPVFSLAPRWQTEAGESKLAFAVGLMAPENLIDMFASGRIPDDIVLQLIERIDVDLSISKPQVESLLARIAQQERDLTPEEAAAEAAQQVRAMAGMAEMLNIARNDGDKLVGAFRYADGVARLNGVEVPLQEYLPDLLNLAGAGLDDDGDDYDEDDFDFDDDDDDEHDHDDDDDHDHDHDHD